MIEEQERTLEEVEQLTELERVDRGLRALAAHRADVMKQFKETRDNMVQERNTILDALDDIKLGNRNLFNEGVKVEVSKGGKLNDALEDLVNNNVSILLDHERQAEIDEEEAARDAMNY